jgi:TolA-binding protein
MRKAILSIILTSSFIFTKAQTVADAVKMISYGKNKSARDILQKVFSANPKDANAIYWIGQSYIATDDIADAKIIYQNALQSGVNDALIIVGMAHVDLLEGGDWNIANQKFETAITMTAETRGKNKGKAPAAIYNAIGRANAIGRMTKDGSSKFGNMDYAIEKLRLAKDIDPNNTESFIYMGLCYRKMGGEFGGEAQKAYTEALGRNPNLAIANHLLGKIYQSQQNKPAMEQYFNAALQNDVAFAPVYLDYYKYYASRDVTLAKVNIEKFLQYADKDCNNDYFYADYLFQAEKFNESLAKAKELENTECGSRVNVLYAYNYDRLNDSLQAKSSIEKFLASTAADKILTSDYEIAIKVLSRFPGNESKAIGYLNNLIDQETNNQQKIQYASQITNLAAKSGNVELQIQSIERLAALRGSTTESDFYKMYTAYNNVKSYNKALEVAKKYIAAYPNSNFGYDYLVRTAKRIDTANATGLLLEANKWQLEFLIKDPEKNKQKLIENYYSQMAHYNDALKDYNKAIELCEEILKLVPNEEQTLKIKENLKKNAERKNNVTPTKPNNSPKDKKTTSLTKQLIKNDEIKRK